jgi:hypothetical protein
MLRDRRYLGWTLAGTVLLAGCGPYEARLHESIAKGGRTAAASGGAAGTNSVTAVAAQVDPTKVHPGPYTIAAAGSNTATGVTIYLPKEFVAGGAAVFNNTPNLGGDSVTPAGAEMVSVMSYYYQDTSGKKYPAVIAFSRLPNNKVADAAQRTAAETTLAATLGNPPPAFADFPTSGGGTWRKATHNAPISYPVNDINGAKEPVASRIDTYVLMTTNEELRIQVMAPATVINTFDFFGEAEAGIKAMTAGPPAKTGT